MISDIHRESDVEAASDILDILQIPAFLCQQTSLIYKAGQSQKPINIKKGQFLSPKNMTGPVGKVKAAGNEQILLTERGTSFGYNRLVSDICSIPIMQKIGFPVVYDATHIIRIYGIPSCDALFIETHIDPERALCDAASMLKMEFLPDLLELVIPISKIVRR